MMRIALDVRLYEEVLYTLHRLYNPLLDTEDYIRQLIRLLEANAYEVTWQRPNPPRKPWYERSPFGQTTGLTGN